jgi:uncharacterized membrane protein YidH (DUF202 family)
MTDGRIFDSGLQPERTDLAWRRTVIGLVVGSLVALRLLPPVLGTWSLGVALVGLFLAVLLWVLADRRERRTQRALLEGDTALPGGGLLLLLTGLAAAGAALGLLYVILL